MHSRLPVVLNSKQWGETDLLFWSLILISFDNFYQTLSRRPHCAWLLRQTAGGIQRSCERAVEELLIRASFSVLISARVSRVLPSPHAKVTSSSSTCQRRLFWVLLLCTAGLLNVRLNYEELWLCLWCFRKGGRAQRFLFIKCRICCIAREEETILAERGSPPSQAICLFLFPFSTSDNTPARYFRLAREIFRGAHPDAAAFVILLHMQQTRSTLWNRWSLSSQTLWCWMMSGLWLAMSFQWTYWCEMRPSAAAAALRQAAPSFWNKEINKPRRRSPRVKKNCWNIHGPRSLFSVTCSWHGASKWGY